MSMYKETVPQMVKMLKNMQGWLAKAEAHATAKKFDVNVLVAQRLAPDQYGFGRQIGAACDSAKYLTAWLGGKEAPKHPDTETTINELKTRIASTLEFVTSVTEKDFETAATRVIPLPFVPGKGLVGRDYATELGLPNFYFHASHAYAILRSFGVELGKTDYIGSLPLRDV